MKIQHLKNSSILERFKEFIAKENLFQPASGLLVAVSGGVDSVVLCELCHKCGLDFSIAHCNFKLRGKESDEDAAFVKKLAGKYGVEYFEREFNTEKYAADNKLSIQEAARDLRYGWFDTLINKSTNQHINYLLTAHHADDNIETILMNFFKGTGINGLKGILPKHDKIVRPLLFAKKEELNCFASENKLVFREDSSNSSDKYTRNYFRNELIPGIEKVFPAVKDNLAENAERFREINYLYHQSLESILKKLITAEGEEIHIPVLKLAKTAALKTILFEIIKEYGFTSSQVDDVMKLLQSGSGKFIRSATHTILRNRKWLIISKLNSSSNTHFLIEEADKEIQFEAATLKIEKQLMPVKIESGSSIAQVDLATVQFPLILRKWKQGDYFYPLGMEKKKKLSRFFIDQKLSLNQKEKTWVIESNKKIIWVVGHRIDNRFKVTGKTKLLLKIDWLSSK